MMLNSHRDFVVIGCDMGVYTGLYRYEERGGVWQHEGREWLEELGGLLFADSDCELVNCGAIARHADTYDLHDAYRQVGISDGEFQNHISTWMNGEGDMSSIHETQARERAGMILASRDLREHRSPYFGEVRNRLMENYHSMLYVMDW